MSQDLVVDYKCSAKIIYSLLGLSCKSLTLLDMRQCHAINNNFLFLNVICSFYLLLRMFCNNG